MGRNDLTFFKYDIENCIEAIKKVEDSAKKFNINFTSSSKLILELKQLLNPVIESPILLEIKDYVEQWLISNMKMQFKSVKINRYNNIISINFELQPPHYWMVDGWSEQFPIDLISLHKEEREEKLNNILKNRRNK